MRTVVKPASSVRVRVGDPDGHPEAVGELQLPVAAVVRVGGEVHVHVDQAGQQRAAAEVEDPRAGRCRVALLADALDAVVVDDHLGPVELAAGEHVHHVRGADHEGIGARDRCHRGAQGQGGKWSEHGGALKYGHGHLPGMEQRP